MKKLRELLPYYGHALMGVGVGCFATAVLTGVIAGVSGLEGAAFFALSVWTFALLVGGTIAGAIGIVFYMTPYDREQWRLRHAVRHAKRR